MKKQGAIILGIGGDNSKGSAGTFYEGVMTTGYASASTEAAVQANIVAAGYNTGGGGSGGTGTIVSGVSSSACMDNNNGSGANGNKVQIWTCDGYAPAQNWTVNANGTITIDGGCLDITGANYNNGTLVELWTCNGGANQQWTAAERGAGQPHLRQVPRRPQRQHHQRHPAPDMELQRRVQPEMDSPVNSGEPTA